MPNYSFIGIFGRHVFTQMHSYGVCNVLWLNVAVASKDFGLVFF